jgi:hypothetical protein
MVTRLFVRLRTLRRLGGLENDPMNHKAMILSVALVSAAFATVPMVGACPQSVIHTFTAAASGGAYTDHQEAVGGGVADVEDSCTDVDQSTTPPTVGDGDPDQGVGGGAFPAVQPDCALPNAHHQGGVGASYYATNFLLPMEWTAGTDGQVPGVPVTPGVNDCTGNGVISNDYNTDPYDCYSGLTGSTSTGVNADVAPNVFSPVDPAQPNPWGPNPYAPCNGVDGLVWVFLASGASVNGFEDSPLLVIGTNPPSVTPHVPASPGASISAPLQGTIYSR